MLSVLHRWRFHLGDLTLENSLSGDVLVGIAVTVRERSRVFFCFRVSAKFLLTSPFDRLADSFRRHEAEELWTRGSSR